MTKSYIGLLGIAADMWQGVHNHPLCVAIVATVYDLEVEIWLFITIPTCAPATSLRSSGADRVPLTMPSLLTPLRLSEFLPGAFPNRGAAHCRRASPKMARRLFLSTIQPGNVFRDEDSGFLGVLCAA
jgi:hypothetical protein